MYYNILLAVAIMYCLRAQTRSMDRPDDSLRVLCGVRGFSFILFFFFRHHLLVLLAERI